MDLLPAELLPPGMAALGLPPPSAPAAPGSGHRRCASAPSLSLDAMADAALQLETTPCSVLDLHALTDETSVSLRRTLERTQRELLAAMQAGVLDSSEGNRDDGGATLGQHSQDGSDGGEGGSDGGGSDRDGQQGRQQQGCCSGGSGQGEGGAEAELELAGLSAREREAALKRAKNREAARRSRERKAGRIAALQVEVDRLRANNFVLLKCVEEVAHKALAARGEQRRLRDKLAKVQAEPGPVAAGAPLLSPSPLRGLGGLACTPPAAQRAAALERELLALEAAPASPTQLLLPRWAEQAPVDVDAGAGAAPQAPLSAPLLQRPTSAELRRQLQRAVAGGAAAAAAESEERALAFPGDGAGSAGKAAVDGGAELLPALPIGATPPWQASAATQHHWLHPSPTIAGRGPQRVQRAPQRAQQHAQQDAAAGPSRVVLRLRRDAAQEGQALTRTCSAPDSLAAAAADVAQQALQASDAANKPPDAQAWFNRRIVA